MPFTDEEIRRWHQDRRSGEHRRVIPVGAPVATCVNCHRPFGSNEGVVTGEAALCDLCSGD